MTGPRGETRARLVATALDLLRRDGYDATTMRRIADEAGVSLGSTYYYFDGKDALVHELYLEVQREHRTRADGALVPGAPLAANLAAVIHAGLDTMAPYHAFGTRFVQHALAPTSSASPFSQRSGEARTLAVGLMADTVAASRGRPPAALRDHLPGMLWLAYLGVTLHWVLDPSEEQARTRALVDAAAPAVARAVSLARLPVARGLVEDVLTIVEVLR